MKVFITGATGFIGLAVGQAFARAGSEVYGLCRSEAKARVLAREEILPVMGELTRPARPEDGVDQGHYSSCE